MLLDKGYKKARALKGGWDAWVEAAGPVEPKTEPKPEPKDKAKQ
jgi:3-mercaptopyruvate sulfurtransferase SseA